MSRSRSQSSDLIDRTKGYALRIIRLYGALPKTTVAQVLGKQLLRSGTSVGAQYREGCRSRSAAEFVSKLSSALQEAEETAYWLDLLIESEVVSADRLTDLRDETRQICAMLTSSINTAKRSRK